MDVASFCALPVGVLPWNAPAPVISVIVKATFSLAADGLAPLAPQQLGLSLDCGLEGAVAELYYGSDFVPRKRGCDVVLVGHARSQRPSREIPFSVAIDQVASHLVAVSTEPSRTVPLLSRTVRRAGTPQRVAPSSGMLADWAQRVSQPGFDFSAFNVAPSAHRLASLPARAQLRLSGLLADVPVRHIELGGVVPRLFHLPGVRGAQPEPVAVVCDTLWIDTDREILTQCWRGVVRRLRQSSRQALVLTTVAAGDIAPPSWATLSARMGHARWHRAAAIDTVLPRPPRQLMPLGAPNSQRTDTFSFPRAASDGESTAVLSMMLTPTATPAAAAAPRSTSQALPNYAPPPSQPQAPKYAPEPGYAPEPRYAPLPSYPTTSRFPGPASFPMPSGQRAEPPVERSIHASDWAPPASGLAGTSQDEITADELDDEPTADEQDIEAAPTTPRAGAVLGMGGGMALGQSLLGGLRAEPALPFGGSQPPSSRSSEQLDTDDDALPFMRAAFPLPPSERDRSRGVSGTEPPPSSSPFQPEPAFVPTAPGSMRGAAVAADMARHWAAAEPDPPASALAAPESAPPSEQLLPLEIYAEIRAALWRQRAPLNQVLAGHDLSESRWRVYELQQQAAIAADARTGRGLLGLKVRNAVRQALRQPEPRTAEVVDS